MRWRRRLITLHRDIGYLCVGLSLVYVISGVAVNHREHWDYNYSTSVTSRQVGLPHTLLGAGAGQPPGQLARDKQEQLVSRLTAKLGRADQPRTAFWRGAQRLSLFFGSADRDIVDYDPETGAVVHTAKQPRFLLRQLNRLHLNEPRHAWTWIADLYAVALGFLALSGLLLVKGRHGLRGRGGVLVALGVLLPILALVLLS